VVLKHRKGNYIRINESPVDNTKTGVTVQDGLTRGPTRLSDVRIPQNEKDVNNQDLLKLKSCYSG